MAATWPNREHIRGDTVIDYLKFVDSDGDALDLASCTILLTVKSAAPSASDEDLDDATAIIRHGIEIGADGSVAETNGFAIGGIDPETSEQVSGATSGVVTHTVTATESTTVTPGSYVYDISITNADGSVKTIINGAKWTVIPDVGRRTEVAS